MKTKHVAANTSSKSIHNKIVIGSIVLTIPSTQEPTLVIV